MPALQPMQDPFMGHLPLEKVILVVEDDEDIATLLVDILTQETPFRVLRVGDGVQALHVLEQTRPCLLITDYLLPRMNGIELYDHVQTSTDMVGIPTIMVSAYMPAHEVAQRQIVGLHKPFELDALLDAVDGLMASFRFSPQLSDGSGPAQS